MNLKKFVVSKSYQVDCFYHYHHFYKKDIRPSRKVPSFKMAAANLFHPGNAKTLFKDYALMAEMLNQWDLVTAVELLPVIGKDKHHNKALLKFLSKPDLTRKEIQEAKTLFRSPGYLKLLTQLQKLDPSWSLILSPRGEALKEAHVQELSGFYYRRSKVRPKVNEFCDQLAEAKGPFNFACLPPFDGHFLQKKERPFFSRRPFMGSFQVGHFDFTLLATHVIYTSPKDPSQMKSILKKSFEVDNHKKLGRGLTKSNYARFSEIKTTLEFMEKLREKFQEKDIILLGDFNIEAKNPFFKVVLNQFPGGEVLIKKPTSLTLGKKNKNGLTGGFSSNYDHFLLDPFYSRECFNDEGDPNAQKFNFFKGKIGQKVETKYIIRHPETLKISSKNWSKMKTRVRALGRFLKKKKTIKRNKIVPDSRRSALILENFKKRVFMNQQNEKKYYQVYKEVLSDHAPIEMKCQSEHDDD